MSSQLKPFELVFVLMSFGPTLTSKCSKNSKIDLGFFSILLLVIRTMYLSNLKWYYHIPFAKFLLTPAKLRKWTTHALYFSLFFNRRAACWTGSNSSCPQHIFICMVHTIWALFEPLADIFKSDSLRWQSIILTPMVSANPTATIKLYFC